MYLSFREVTEDHAKNEGNTLPVRFCIKCKKHRLPLGGTQIRGTSRHNPHKFICGECNGNNKRSSFDISESTVNNSA